MLNLKDPSDLRFATPPPTSTGTWTFTIIRVRNLIGKPDTPRDWGLSATTIDSANYDAEIANVLSPITFPISEPNNKIRPWIINPADNLLNKSLEPIAAGAIIEGYLLAWFAEIPRDTLHLPGTRFTIKCKDAYSDAESEKTFVWKGKNDPPTVYSGLTHSLILPLVPNP